jgi:hypothetical protein
MGLTNLPFVNFPNVTFNFFSLKISGLHSDLLGEYFSIILYRQMAIRYQLKRVNKINCKLEQSLNTGEHVSMRQSSISNNFKKYTYQKKCKCHEINIKTKPCILLNTSRKLKCHIECQKKCHHINYQKSSKNPEPTLVCMCNCA